MDKILLVLKGAAMGIAEVIPGVSGGTIAFITGIYERLLNSIKSFDTQFINLVRKGNFIHAFMHVDGSFIFLLLLGMFVGIVTGIFTIGMLLEQYPAPVWAFFFGLIVVSAFYISAQIKDWNWQTIGYLLAGIIVAFTITVLNPGEGSSNLIAVFFSGMVAISALMLPGISGSFILLILGMYTIIRRHAEMALSELNVNSIIVILIFALGCGVGLSGFSRLLSYTFEKYRHQTFAILTGFMIGSLNKIWPWRNVEELLNKETGEIVIGQLNIIAYFNTDGYKILKEVNVLPSSYYMNEPYTVISIVCAIFGFFLVYLLTRQKEIV